MPKLVLGLLPLYRFVYGMYSVRLWTSMSTHPEYPSGNSDE